MQQGQDGNTSGLQHRQLPGNSAGGGLTPGLLRQYAAVGSLNKQLEAPPAGSRRAGRRPAGTAAASGCLPCLSPLDAGSCSPMTATDTGPDFCDAMMPVATFSGAGMRRARLERGREGRGHREGSSRVPKQPSSRRSRSMSAGRQSSRGGGSGSSCPRLNPQPWRRQWADPLVSQWRWRAQLGGARVQRRLTWSPRSCR